MKRIDIALALGTLFAILLTSFTSFAGDCDDVRQSVVRLHILANSDSQEDQTLKLAVRDAILDRTSALFTASRDKVEAEQLAQEHLEDILDAAREEIARQGYDYDVSARLVNRYFETREYEDFTLPAGRYDAVQVEIGAGQGKNWWCVMFPPMCLPAATGREGLPLEEQIGQLGETPHYVPKFALVEAIESLQEQFGGGEVPLTAGEPQPDGAE